MNGYIDVAILDHMDALSEGVRSRLMLLLDHEELTVSDLCAVLQLPQSTVSRHLKTLFDRGWVESRPDGTRRLYRGTVTRLEAAAQELWELTRREVEGSAIARADHERLRTVVALRSSRSRVFFDSAGARWDALRDELFGGTFHFQALLGFLPQDWCVLDLGSGTGTVMESLAPHVRRVIGVDSSSAMRELAERRLVRFHNVELRKGELEALPVNDDEADAAMLMLVLHHVQQPNLAVREAVRCLRPGGHLVIVDMLPHDRVEYRIEMGHTWLGFPEDVVRGFFEEAGLGPARFTALPPALDARGPNLFAASASKEE